LSSGAAHRGRVQPDAALAMEVWRERWNEWTWRGYLAAQVTEEEITALRQCTYSGRPLGTREFIDALEKCLQRRLAQQKGGFPKKKAVDKNQGAPVFDGE